MKQIMLHLVAGSVVIEPDELDGVIAELTRVRDGLSQVGRSSYGVNVYIDYAAAHRILAEKYANDDVTLTRNLSRLWAVVVRSTAYRALAFDALCNVCHRHLFESSEESLEERRRYCNHLSDFRSVIIGTASLRSNLASFTEKSYRNVGPIMRQDMAFLVAHLPTH